MSKSIGFYCPVCSTRMRVNGRREMTTRLSTVSIQCVNPECMASWTGCIEIMKQVQPSLKQAQPDNNHVPPVITSVDTRQLSLLGDLDGRAIK